MSAAASYAKKLSGIATEYEPKVICTVWVVAGIAGAMLGGFVGTVLGLPLAFFTFGMSMVAGAGWGGLIGFSVGLCSFGMLVIFVVIVKHACKLRDKFQLVTEIRELIDGCNYGKVNHLTEVYSKRDLATGFSSGPGGSFAPAIGRNFAQYLEEAVHLYRGLNNNKTGITHLRADGQQGDDEIRNPPELDKFETIVGNFQREGSSSGWMFAKREAVHSPAKVRELWLVVRGSTTSLDWFHDAEALLPPKDVGLGSVGICIGFYKKACSIIDDMEKRKAADAVANAASKTPFDRIFLVGHSLAGAVVTQFQAFTAVPFSNPSSPIGEDAHTKHMFGKLQQIWISAFGGADTFNSITASNVSGRFLTFALEPAPAFKSQRRPQYWEIDSYDLQTNDTFVKRILETTLILTIYGGDPVPRLNIEVGGLALPPMKLGVFYSNPDKFLMLQKYNVKANTFYLMDGPLTDNRVTRFLTWSQLSAVTLEGRVVQAKNIVNALFQPEVSAAQLAAGGLGLDHVAFFRPGTFARGLRDLPAVS